MGISRRLKSSYWKLRVGMQRLFSLQFGIMYQRPPTEQVSDHFVTELVEGVSLRNLSSADVQERLSDGHRLFVRQTDSGIAAYAWVASPGCRVTLLFDVRFPVPEGSIYVWDVFTHSSHRRKGYATELHHVVSSLVPGIHSVFCAVDRNNKPSRRQIGKMGYSPVFRYAALRIVGRTVVAYANAGNELVPLHEFLRESVHAD